MGSFALVDSLEWTRSRPEASDRLQQTGMKNRFKPELLLPSNTSFSQGFCGAGGEV